MITSSGDFARLFEEVNRDAPNPTPSPRQQESKLRSQNTEITNYPSLRGGENKSSDSPKGNKNE